MRLTKTTRSIILLPAVLLVSMSAALLLAQEVAKEGSFTGSWSVSGTSKSVDMDGGSAQLMEVKGPVQLRSQGGLAREFDAECVAVRREGLGSIGRCSWTDADGDQIFIEIAGTIVGPAGTARDSEGEVVGGTGKYEGMEGAYHTEWLFIDSRFDSKVIGRDTKTEGTWRRP